MSADLGRPVPNKLLAALPAKDMRRLRASLQPILLDLGTVIYEAGDRARFVYFPTSGIISLLQVMANGSSGEIAVVGNEGVVGMALFMGAESSPSRAVVQSAASAFRLEARALMDEFKRGGELHRLLLRYTQALFAQMSQTAVCNRHHSIHQQLCRWLLLSLDRLSSNEVQMTQDLIANMLGVRREGVTEAARSLQEMNLISYSRGRIRVLDRPGLERSACECYAVVKAETDRLESPPTPGPSTRSR